MLELIFINWTNQRVEGWFYNPEKETTQYLLCRIDKDANINICRQQLTLNRLQRVEVMLVNRLAL